MLINANAVTTRRRLAGLRVATAFDTLNGREAMPTASLKQASTLRERIRVQTEHNQRMAAQIAALMPDGLTAFVRAAYTGDNAHVNVGAAENADAAEREILAAVERAMGEPLTAGQRNAIGMAVVMEWNRIQTAKRDGLREIQQRLANPFRVFAS